MEKTKFYYELAPTCIYVQSVCCVFRNTKVTVLRVCAFTPVRNAQRCCSAAEWLQEALQNSCKEAGCSSRKFWLFGAAL